jgi:CBS domain-containing protein
MKRDVITVSPDTLTQKAIEIMRQKNIGCLPVIKDERLVGIVTLSDILHISSRLLEEKLQS